MIGSRLTSKSGFFHPVYIYLYIYLSICLSRCVEEKMDGPGSPAKGECGTRGLTPLTNR